jgi:hypothetical protein
MAPLLELALYLAVGAGGYSLSIWRSSARARHWRAAAQEAGVIDLVKGPGVSSLQGRSGSLEVELGWSVDVAAEGRFRAVVRGLLPGLVLHATGGEAALGIRTGDDTFDPVIEVRGPDAGVRAVLDRETRALVKDWLLSGPGWPSGRYRVANGELCVELPVGARRRVTEVLARELRQALNVAHRLVRPPDVPERLCRNVRTDPQPGVRVRNLQALLRDFPGHTATHEAVAAARQDPSDEVRLGAGLALGTAGLDQLREIAESEHVTDGCAAQALVGLGPEMTPDRVRSLLQRSLRRRRLRTAEACLAWLGWHGGAEAVEPLAKVLAIEQGELGAAAASALWASGLPEAEAPLVHALQGDSDEARVAAAEALEGLGTAQAVWPLKEAMARHSGHKAFVNAARQAVAAIQSRLTGSAGELSLAGAEAGQLDLAAEDAAGRLSLAPPDPAKTDE